MRSSRSLIVNCEAQEMRAIKRESVFVWRVERGQQKYHPRTHPLSNINKSVDEAISRLLRIFRGNAIEIE